MGQGERERGGPLPHTRGHAAPVGLQRPRGRARVRLRRRAHPRRAERRRVYRRPARGAVGQRSLGRDLLRRRPRRAYRDAQRPLPPGAEPIHLGGILLCDRLPLRRAGRRTGHRHRRRHRRRYRGHSSRPARARDGDGHACGPAHGGRGSVGQPRRELRCGHSGACRRPGQCKRRRRDPHVVGRAHECERGRCQAAHCHHRHHFGQLYIRHPHRAVSGHRAFGRRRENHSSGERHAGRVAAAGPARLCGADIPPRPHHGRHLGAGRVYVCRAGGSGRLV